MMQTSMIVIRMVIMIEVMKPVIGMINFVIMTTIMKMIMIHDNEYNNDRLK